MHLRYLEVKSTGLGDEFDVGLRIRDDSWASD